jgi:hypothetical protein
MTNANPTPNPTPANESASSSYVPPTPARCFRGGVISGGLTFVMYLLTQSIVQALAGVPLPTKSAVAANIAVAVRTLIVGVSTMVTAIFGIAALGLLALGVQLLFKPKQPD